MPRASRHPRAPVAAIVLARPAFAGAALFALLLIGMDVGAAIASSDDAWAELFAKVDKACLKRSGLTKPHRIGDYYQTDDDKSVLVMVGGTSGADATPAVVACVFDKKTLKAAVATTDLNVTANP